MVVVSPSPSPFATLLRRSKFATYDPRIAQVFTAYGGHAHRGNWGFKRPIGVRRRGAFITVKSVDTPAQQTEWNSGEGQAKWIQNWEELNHEAALRPFTRWHQMAGSAQSHEFVDSGLAPMESGAEEGEKDGWKPQVVRNIHAMSPKEFKTYLEELREKRPAFMEFLRRKGESNLMLVNKSSFQLAQQQRSDHVEFIVEETSKAVNSMDSRVIDPVPHKTGGALYSHPSLLQTFLTTKPQPGRILTDGKRFSRSPETYVASFAGMTRTVLKKHSSGVQRMNWSNPGGDSRAVTQFRPENGYFKGIPRVVGKNRQGVKGVKSVVVLRNVPSKPDFGRSNSHMPGSLAYVAASPAPLGKKGGRYPMPLDISATNRPHRAKPFTPAKTAAARDDALSMLRRLVKRDPNAADNDPYPEGV
jgi:hypothetical protein